MLGKLTPQHLAQHGLTLQEGYRRFPELGFSKRARLVIQPSPDGLLKTGEVFGLMVAGAGFEPATFGYEPKVKAMNPPLITDMTDSRRLSKGKQIW